MFRYLPPLVFSLALATAGYAQTAVNSQTPPPTANRHIDPPRTQTVEVPAPPDLVVPDGSVHRESKNDSALKRAADKLAPVCLDMIFHTCWFTPLPDIKTGIDPQLSKNLEVGNFYLEKKNYRAAESRFREAVELRPLNPEANFKLAVTLDKLGQTAEACERYQAYLNLRPEGPWAADARKALERLQPKPRGAEKPVNQAKASDPLPK